MSGLCLVFAYALGSFRTQLSHLYAANQVRRVTLHTRLRCTWNVYTTSALAGSQRALFSRVKKRVGLIQKAIRLNTGMTCAKKFKAKSRYTCCVRDDVTELQQRCQHPATNPSLKFRWNFVKYGTRARTPTQILHFKITSIRRHY